MSNQYNWFRSFGHANLKFIQKIVIWRFLKKYFISSECTILRILIISNCSFYSILAIVMNYHQKMNIYQALIYSKEHSFISIRCTGLHSAPHSLMGETRMIKLNFRSLIGPRFANGGFKRHVDWTNLILPTAQNPVSYWTMRKVVCFPYFGNKSVWHISSLLTSSPNPDQIKVTSGCWSYTLSLLLLVHSVHLTHHTLTRQMAGFGVQMVIYGSSTYVLWNFISFYLFHAKKKNLYILSSGASKCVFLFILCYI